MNLSRLICGIATERKSFTFIHSFYLELLLFPSADLFVDLALVYLSPVSLKMPISSLEWYTPILFT